MYIDVHTDYLITENGDKLQHKHPLIHMPPLLVQVPLDSGYY